jgi:hypothetical protein
MHRMHHLPRCDAITTKRCAMSAKPGETKCRYHLGDWRTEAQHARNREGRRRYWERWRAAKAAKRRLAVPHRRHLTDKPLPRSSDTLTAGSISALGAD